MMDEKSLDVQTGEEEESCSRLEEEIRLEECSTSGKPTNESTNLHGIQGEKALESDFEQQLNGKGCIQDLSLQQVHSTDPRISKYMQCSSVSESYLQYCLDLLEFKVANSLRIVCSPTVPCKISVNLLSPKKNGMSGSKLGPHQRLRRNTSDLGPFVIQCSSSTKDGQWILSTVDRNQTLREILEDPLLHSGALGGVVNLSRVGLIDVKGIKSSSTMNVPSRLSIGSAEKLETEPENVKELKHGSKSLNKRFFSFSNTNSMGSGHSFSLTSFQGMLICKWENKLPHFLYSVHGQMEVYVAKMLKVESSDFKNLDYIYFFYTKKGGRKSHGSRENSLGDLVAKMTVSSSLTFCSDSKNSKVMETEFVLYGADESQIGVAASSDLTLAKQVHTNKVVDTFRPKHLHKNKSCLKFGTQKSTPESCSAEASQYNQLERRGGENVVASPTNFELAAIIVKEQVHDSQQNAIGGWGLKFLEKVQVEHASTSPKASTSNSDLLGGWRTDTSRSFSTTVNVILPAGVHGGPITKNGGPSALTERWRSGGHCDCGGWDIGCPLTVLSNQSSEEALTEGEGKPVNLVKQLQGTKQSIPHLELVKILDDKYQICFQSTLSNLQSFSIGVALIHAQFHSLIARDVQMLK